MNGAHDRPEGEEEATTWTDRWLRAAFGASIGLVIGLIAGFSHMPALDDVTPPDAKRFVLGAIALAVLVLTIAPLPAAARGMMLDCPYL